MHVRGEQLTAVIAFQEQTERTWPAQLKGYSYRRIIPNSKDAETQPGPEDKNPLWDFISDPKRNEETRKAPKENYYYYYGALRAGPSCIGCHTDPGKVAIPRPDLKPDDLMAVVRIRLSTQMIEEGFHTNRALLLSFVSCA